MTALLQPQNFETKPINEKKVDCVYGELTAQFVLLADFNTSENRKTEKTPAYFVSQSDAQSIFNDASVLGAKLRRYLCARSVFKRVYESESVYFLFRV